MTHPKPSKDTREQARAVVTEFAGHTFSNATEGAEYLAQQIAAALSRARREGMEEAAGIADDVKLLRGILEDAPIKRLFETDAQFIENYKLWYRDRRSKAFVAAKEVDHG